LSGAEGPAQAATRVVGVALLTPGPHGRRVLAARRAGAADPGRGRWELPGGKCRPGEPLTRAAERELHEELGCRVEVTGVVPGRVAIRPGLTLEVVTARLVDGEPCPLEHDALRWLAADQLDEVDWLPPDVPFLPRVAQLLVPEEDR
jgi:8-oxo-dGTP diphosphatase